MLMKCELFFYILDTRGDLYTTSEIWSAFHLQRTIIMSKASTDTTQPLNMNISHPWHEMDGIQDHITSSEKAIALPGEM